MDIHHRYVPNNYTGSFCKEEQVFRLLAVPGTLNQEEQVFRLFAVIWGP
jgi:hypothetical protein